jgi:anaerobic selenocysteine-containing dehydrogenase
VTPAASPIATSGASTAREVVRGACPHDCPDTCATLVTVEDGRAVRIAGDPAHPFTNGFLCAKVNRYLERTYHRDRLLTPLRRVGPKGSGRFAPVSWDEALGEVAERLNEIRRSTDGPQAILPYSYAGTMGSCRARRWTGVCSTTSARRGSRARSARRRGASGCA